MVFHSSILDLFMWAGLWVMQAGEAGINMFHMPWVVIMCRRCNYLPRLSCYVAEVPVIVDVVVDVVMSSPTKAWFHSGLECSCHGYRRVFGVPQACTHTQRNLFSLNFSSLLHSVRNLYKSSHSGLSVWLLPVFDFVSGSLSSGWSQPCVFVFIVASYTPVIHFQKNIFGQGCIFCCFCERPTMRVSFCILNSWILFHFAFLEPRMHLHCTPRTVYQISQK